MADAFVLHWTYPEARLQFKDALLPSIAITVVIAFAMETGTQGIINIIVHYSTTTLTQVSVLVSINLLIIIIITFTMLFQCNYILCTCITFDTILNTTLHDCTSRTSILHSHKISGQCIRTCTINTTFSETLGFYFIF